MVEGLPTGTVTFLFSDVEGSTRLLQEIGEEAYGAALADHRGAIEEVSAGHGGHVVDREGDASFIAFENAAGALQAALDIQRVLAAGPIKVRVGVHTGTPLQTASGYVGLDVHRAARIAGAAHGGQVVFSSATRALVPDDRAPGPVRDLGEHRLKDLAAGERLFQLGEQEFPPLRSLPTTNLPVPTTPFVGRRRELGELVELLRRGGIRLLTVTGPGGMGKTRLALQAAAEVSGEHLDGVWWTSFATLRDASLALPAIAQTLGAIEEQERGIVETLAARLEGRQVLLVLDNAEHLLPDVAGEISSLVSSCPSLHVLVTSRERLQLGAEMVWPLPPFVQDDAEELFIGRARAAGVVLETSDAISELCARLDELPLALELAAARTVVFSPEQLVERLSRRLDLFKGSRDADPRQLTLRATFDWSYELLSQPEQDLFCALAVFSGGCGYEAAEEVAGAEPDTLQALLERSLLQRRDSSFGPRYWMLATVREYALERLDARPDVAELRRLHAHWCLRHALELLGIEGPGQPREATTDEVQRFRDDYDNTRAALEWAWGAGEDELAVQLGTAACRFWLRVGLYRDAVAWLDAAMLRLDAAQPVTRLHALETAGLIAFFVVADSDRADEYWASAALIADELGLDEEAAWIDHRRVAVLWERGDVTGAIAGQERLLAAQRETGDQLAIADLLHTLGEARRDVGDFERAERDLLAADAIYRELDATFSLLNNSHSLGDLALDRGDFAVAIDLYRATIDSGPDETARVHAYCLAGIASALAATGHDREAARLWGAVCAAEHVLAFRMLGAERRRYEGHLARLEDHDAWREGKTLTLEQALASLDQSPPAVTTPFS